MIERTLYNGVKIPVIGLGPGGMGYKPNARPARAPARWNIPLRAWNKIKRPVVKRLERMEYVSAVANGIRAGFRLIDYSTAYGNGGLIADAIDKSGVSRNDIFLTGRISNSAQFKGAQAVEDQIKRHLEEYRTDHVDVLMFHWPVTGCYEQTWRVVCNAYEKGLTKSVGVANCHRRHIETLMKCGLKPMINQFEVHPLFTQKDLIKFNQDLGIQVESYTPIARFDDRLMRLPKLKKIAGAHGKTSVQTILRWHIQQGLVPIIRSLNSERQKENYGVFDFELSSDEMAVIDSFNIDARIRYDPDNCDFTIL